MDLAYRFGVYTLDPARRELHRGDQPLKLPPKSFDLLCYLLENPSRVVQKQELLDALWRGEEVTPSVIPVTVRNIREVFGEGGSGEILKTVRGRGYRIVCSVERFTPRPTSPPAPGHRPGFVGREQVMQELDLRFRAALRGRGSGVLLSGESGIGKTRVLDEFARSARAAGVMVLPVRCPDDPGAPPFWPILQLMHEAELQLDGPVHADRASLGRKRVDSAQRKLSELFLGKSVEALELEVARLRVARTAVQWLAAISEISPVVLAIDDLHCADAGSVSVCEQLLREVSGRSVFALLCARDLPAHRADPHPHPLQALLELNSLRRIPLRGLDPDAIDAFLRVETGVRQSDAWVRALADRTQGNPFFLRETVRLLVARGEFANRAEPTSLGLPHGVREAVGRRMGTLSPACSRLMEWASVIGLRFSAEVLSRVCQISDAETRGLLDEAQDAQLVTPLADSESANAAESFPEDAAISGAASFTFVHGLIRETLYEELSGPERVLRHRRVAEVLLQCYGRDPDHVFDLAWHFFEAAPGGDIDRAVEMCLRAARHARRRYAYESQVRQLERALRAEELRLPRDDIRYCCLVMARAGALWRAGQYARAQEAFRHAVDLTRALGRADLLGYTVLGMVGWPRFNRIGTEARMAQLEWERVSRLARDALRGLGEDNPALRSRLIGILVRTERNHAEDPRRLAATAVALARESSDERALFHGLVAQVAALSGPREVRAALALASEATELARRLGAPPRAFAAYEVRIPLLLAVGEMQAADADIEAAGVIAKRQRIPAYAYAVARFELARALGDGDLPRARELLESVRHLGVQAEDETVVWASRALEFWIAAAQGREEELQVALGSSVLPIAHGGAGGAIAAYLFMLAHDRLRCVEHFELLAKDDFASIPSGPSWLWHISTSADVCVYLRDRSRASVLLELLAPFEDLNVMSNLYCYRGSTALPMARLAHLLGERDEAKRLFEQAVSFNLRIGAWPSVVWAQLSYADLLAEGDGPERRRSDALVHEARSLARPRGLEMSRLGISFPG